MATPEAMRYFNVKIIERGLYLGDLDSDLVLLVLEMYIFGHIKADEVSS